MPALAWLAAVAWERWMAQRAWAKDVFALLAVISVGAAIGINQYAIQYTQWRSAQGASAALSCRIQEGDVVAVYDDYPYDLMFYTQRHQPIEVIQDWVKQAEVAGDDWRRELMDGAPFDPVAGAYLKPMQRLNELKTNPRAWVLGPVWQEEFDAQTYTGFKQVYRDDAWVLYQGVALVGGAAESPKTTEQESLGGCENQGKK